MESRLEAYRAKKRKALVEEQHNAKYWDLITLAPLRRRVFGETNIEKLDSDVHNSNVDSIDQQSGSNNKTDDTTEEIPVNNEWSKLDISITLVKCLLWICLLIVFIKIEFALVYIATSGFALIYLNLGNEGDKRKRGDEDASMSAYSVFNPGLQSIDGTFTAQQFEKQMGLKGSGAAEK